MQGDLRAEREFCTSAVKVGLLRKWHLSENQKKGHKLAKESRGGAAFQEKEWIWVTEYDLRTYQTGSYFA